MNRDFALIVDDDADTLLLVSEIVKIAGYDALTADHFDAAVALVAKQPKVILLDIVMPNQLCDRLVDHLGAAQSMIPVLLMSSLSADGLEAKRRELVSRGVNAPCVLPKPFWVDALLSALAEALPGASTDSALS
jgi:two-component system, OmpR family, KDP operon response regulator KdpE